MGKPASSIAHYSSHSSSTPWYSRIVAKGVRSRNGHYILVLALSSYTRVHVTQHFEASVLVCETVLLFHISMPFPTYNLFKV